MLKKIFLKKISSVLGLFIVCAFSLTIGAILLRVAYSAFTQPTTLPSADTHELGALADKITALEAKVGDPGDLPTTSTVFGKIAEVKAGGGGGLKVYKSDGITEVGKFLGYSPSASGNNCDDILYSVAPNYNIINMIGVFGCRDLVKKTWYYSSNNCSGFPMNTDADQGGCGVNCYSHNYQSIAVDDDNLCTFTGSIYASKRDPDTGICTTTAGTVNQCQQKLTFVPYTRICGAVGQCQVK